MGKVSASRQFRIVVGPSEMVSGHTDVSVWDGDDLVISTGWRGAPRPKGRDVKTDDWIAQLRSHLPEITPQTGGRWQWGTAEVRPSGWSPGGTDAPNGAEVLVDLVRGMHS